MKIGDRVSRTPSVAENDRYRLQKKEPPRQAGTVIYIHPLGRFFTLRFDCGFCEAFTENPATLEDCPASSSRV